MATNQIKPDLQTLQAALANIVTVNTSERIGALRRVASWYEELIPFVRMTFTPSEEKAFQRGQLCAVQGRGGATPGEQEQGLRTAVRMYEKALLGKYPSVETYYDRLEKDRIRLEEKAKALRQKFDDLFQPLERCFRSLGIGFEVRNLEKARMFDDQGNVIYSEAYAGELMARMKVEGSMAVVLGEACTVLRASSVIKDALGRASLDLTKLNTRLPDLFTCLADHARIGGFRVNLSASTSTPAPAPATTTPQPAPVGPKPHFATKTSPNYRPGSLSAVLLERLQNAPGGYIRLELLFAGINSKAPRRLLQDLINDGRTSGLWTITVTGRGYRAAAHFSAGVI